jgi:hypothetical protein
MGYPPGDTSASAGSSWTFRSGPAGRDRSNRNGPSCSGYCRAVVALSAGTSVNRARFGGPVQPQAWRTWGPERGALKLARTRAGRQSARWTREPPVPQARCSWPCGRRTAGQTAADHHSIAVRMRGESTAQEAKLYASRRPGPGTIRVKTWTILSFAPGAACGRPASRRRELEAAQAITSAVHLVPAADLARVAHDARSLRARCLDHAASDTIDDSRGRGACRNHRQTT